MAARTSAGGVALIAIALALLAGCRRQPKCHGELDSDDLFRLQELRAGGKYPCPEHLEPVIEVDRGGVTLGGRLVAGADELPSGAPRRIGGLFSALKSNRETWKQVHPAESFDARPKVRIDGGLDFVVAASALSTTAYAGYPNATVSAGNVSFEMYYAVPGPPSPDEEPKRTTELLVTRLEPRGYAVALREGNVLTASSPELGFEAVPGWVAQQCTGAPEPCVQVIALDMRGEFVTTATLIRSILDGPGFRTKFPRLRFVMPAS